MENKPAQAQSEPAPVQKKKADQRSLGQWAFDTIIYGGVINTLVFATSILATYLTNHGRQLVGTESKSLFSRFARGMQDRGEWLDGKLMKAGMSHDRAGDFRMVAFSFLDGSIFAMLAKPLEDQRENIARWIDKRFSKDPVPEQTYHNEPKQTWSSVLGGRLATFAAVFTTYKMLDKLHVRNGSTGAFENLNKTIFSNTGEKIGSRINSWSWVKLKFPKLARQESIFNLPGLFKIGVFEAFYTTVCTAGLYLTSRLFAGKGSKKHEMSGSGQSLDPTEGAPLSAWSSQPVSSVLEKSSEVINTNAPAAFLDGKRESVNEESPEKPRPQINEVTHAGRQVKFQPQLVGA